MKGPPHCSRPPPSSPASAPATVRSGERSVARRAAVPTGRSLLFPRVCKRSENVAERTAKARQNVLTVQLVVRSHGRNSPVCPIDPGVTPDLVEDPDEPHTGAEPLPHLFQHLAGPVAGREDFGHPVRRELGVAL